MQPVAVGVWSFVLLLSSSAGRATESPARWTLTTADTRLVIGAAAGGGPALLELSGPGGWNWTAHAPALPLVARAVVDGAPRTLQWGFRKAVEDRSDGMKVALMFATENPALELTSVWHARGGPGPVRHNTTIVNRSDRPVTLFAQESLDLSLVVPGDDASVTYINDDGSLPDATGVYRERLAEGYQKTLRFSEEQDFIPFAAIAAGSQGVYVGWEWSLGRMTIAARQAPRGASIKVGSGDDFKTNLAPGQTFEVPPVLLGAYQGDLDDAANSLRKYLFHYSMPAVLRTDSSYPKVEWNAFAATGKRQGSWDSTETHYYGLVEDAAEMGFDEVVLDVGWWPGDATHKPHPPTNDPVDWPRGIVAACDHAHRKGMRFGLYWNCNPSMTTLEGIRHRQDDARYLYDQFRIDFFRSDGTDGNVLQTGGHGPGCRAQYAEETGYWQTKGYYEVLDALYASIPNFSYENCSGGGRMKDYGILRRSVKIQNQDRYYPIDGRRSFYDSSHALHPMQLAALCGSWAEWQAAGSVYEFRSASMGAAYWHPDGPRGGNGGPVWTDLQKAQIKKAVATYKTRLRPLIREGNLYHVFPRPDDKHWDGIEYFDPVAKKGAVYVFRPDSPEERHTVRLRGLNAAATYWVTSEDNRFAPFQATGQTLIETGLALHLPERHGSDIVFLQDATLGKPDDGK